MSDPGRRQNTEGVLALSLLTAVLVLASCREREPAAVHAAIVRIDGEEEITFHRFETYLRSTLEGTEAALDSQAMSRLFDQFLDGRLILRLALDQGLPEADADPRRAVAYLLREALEETWDEEIVRSYYEAHRDEFRRPERVRLRQILVEDRAKAREAQEALAAGEDFARVAARLSQGPRAHLGGAQGWLAREDLPLGFADLISELAPGEVSGIVDADYGYHIFQVVERSASEIVGFEEVEHEIRDALRRQHVDEAVAKSLEVARERYEVEIFPANFPFEYRGSYAHRSHP